MIANELNMAFYDKDRKDIVVACSKMNIAFYDEDRKDIVVAC